MSAFRRLFLAQVVALTGTGLASVALGLLAWQMAGERAGTVLGTALAVKMVAYVTMAPLASALADRLPRRAFLVALDLIRAGVIACLPFVSAEWQVYALIFVLQSASAGFTPAFQSALPDLLPDPQAYTRGLSWMRLAEDLEQILSPLLAAALLTFVSFPMLFAGTVLGHLLSAALVAGTALPPRAAVAERFWQSLTKGLALYAASPSLRGLLALEGAVAAAGAMVYVNTVVLVEGRLGLGQGEVALAFAAFGGASMVSALAMPRLIAHLGDRAPMLAGALAMLAAVAALPLATQFAGLVALWALAGAGFAATQVPIGRILTAHSAEAERGALFAAQFALSHGCWLVAYPLAGWLGASLGLNATALALAGLGAACLILARTLWPSGAHAHPDLPADHPHLLAHAHPHAHPPQRDALHRLAFPTRP